MLPFLIRGEKKLQPSRLRLPKILANPPFSLFKRNLRSPQKSSAPPPLHPPAAYHRFKVCILRHQLYQKQDF